MSDPGLKELEDEEQRLDDLLFDLCQELRRVRGEIMVHKVAKANGWMI